MHESDTYCLAPFNPCSTTVDGICDDSRGTKSCAENTDSFDCDCDPKLSEASCDPVAQCGCGRDATCVTRKLDSNLTDDNVLQLTATCVRAGTRQQGAPCDGDYDCARGHMCNADWKICNRYCDVEKGCGDADCFPFSNEDAVQVGVCMIPCDRNKAAPCAEGLACVSFEPRFGGFLKHGGDYCFKP